MPGLKLFLFLAVVFLAALAPAWGHHGDAGRYDENVVVMTGTVVELQWVDPHAMIVLDIPNDKGVNVRWQAELGGRNALSRAGWTRNTLKTGDKITVTGRRVKSGAPYMNLTERANIVMTATGKELFRTPNYGQPAPAAK
jgi:uncharacterized protein YodC (DUF2158 family)